MNDFAKNIKNTIIKGMPGSTWFIQSFFHTPSETARSVFWVVVRAGHLRAAPDYRIERKVSAGHDLLLCMRGQGFVLSAGRRFSVGGGQLAWIDGHHHHGHWPDPACPWELLWIRIDGPGLELVAKLLTVRESPVFFLREPKKMAYVFRRILRLMRLRPQALEALVHAELARLIGTLFEIRQRNAFRSFDTQKLIPAELLEPLTSMSIYFHRPWRVHELAKMAGMSASHFFRCFRKCTGSSPIDWLRRERISQAKRRLIESGDSIAEIAEQVGYSDQFYFSRDFKRFTTLSPSHYRRQESGQSSQAAINYHQAEIIDRTPGVGS